MLRLKLHNNYIINYDLISKLNFKNILEIPKFKKIVINIGLIDIISNKKKLILISLFLEILSGQKGFLTKSKKNKINLKLKKGSITGCKVTLRNNNLIIFLDKLLIFFFPRIQNFEGIYIKHYNRFSFNINNPLFLFEFLNEFMNFKYIYKINCTFVITSKKINQLILFINSLNFPIKKAKITQ